MTTIERGTDLHVRKQISDATGVIEALVGLSANPTTTKLVAVLDRVIADTSITNTVTETTLYTKTIDHADINGYALRLTFGGTFLNNTGATSNPRIRVKFGSTTVVDSGSGATFAEATNASTRAWRATVVLTSRSTTTQELFLDLAIGNAGTVTTGVGGILQTAGTQIIENACAETTSGAGTKALAVTWQHDAASTNLTITLKTAILERL